MVNASTSRLQLISRDGTKLNALLTAPDNKQEIKAAILVVHGLQSSAEWHRSTMEAWAKKGIASIVFDRRGSGASEGERGHFDRASDLQDDTSAAFERLKLAVSSQTPLYVFGNSFGFMVSVPFAQSHASEIKGLMLSVPASASTKESDYTLKEKAKIIVNFPHAKHNVAFGSEFITDNPKGQEFIKNDPYFLSQFTTSFLVNALFMRAKANKIFATLPVPALAIFANQDRIVDTNTAAKNLAKTAVGPTTQVFIDGDHDLVLDEKGDQVAEAVYAWIKTHK